MPTCPESVQFRVTNPETGSTATYTIRFIGVTLSDNTSTWCYEVEVDGDPALSHWILGLCPDPFPTLVDATRADQPVVFEAVDNDIIGVKFDEGVSEDDEVIKYCVTIEGQPNPTAVDVAVKGGPGDEVISRNALCGPGCNHVPPPPRLRRGFVLY